jgi:voltage-gated sodium channel
MCYNGLNMSRLIRFILSDRVVMSAIVLNTVALLMFEMTVSDAPNLTVWFWIDYACVVFFLLEAVLKIRTMSWSRYWASWWNRFDFTIVVISLPALAGPVLDSHDFAFILVLRLGRLFRLFRVLAFIPNLDHLVLGVRRALRASVGVFLALMLIILILAVGASLLFRDVDPEHFGNPIVSAYSIFQVFTLEGWNEIPEQLEQRAEESDIVKDPKKFALGARLFFVAAVFIGGILGLSLANAVFVDEMMMDNTDELERKVDLLTEEVRALRRELGRRSHEEN